MFNLLPCPNSIRYSWFWSGPQRQTRVDSSFWPPGTVAKLPSGTSPGPPQNPKIQNHQNLKSKIPKSKITKIPKAKIQNPQNPKSQKPKSKIPTIQNPQNPKSKLFWPDFGILDLGFWIIRKQFFTWGPQRPKFWILAGDFGFWGFWILGILDFGFWILGIWDFGFWGFWILGPTPKSKIQTPQNPKSKIPNPNCFGQIFWILDFGFWLIM